MIIKLVRHSESQANVADSGQSPVADHIVPLTPRGFDQARGVGRKLGSSYLKDSLIYTSPFLRACQTLTAILEVAEVNPEEIRDRKHSISESDRRLNAQKEGLKLSFSRQYAGVCDLLKFPHADYTFDRVGIKIPFLQHSIWFENALIPSKAEEN